MRIMILGAAAAAAFALAACGNNAATDAPAADAASFPSLAAASYRAEAVSTAADGKQTRVVQIRSGPKTRMEFASEQGAVVMLFDSAAQSAHAIMPAQRMAIRLAAGGPDAFAVSDPSQIWSAGAQGATPTHTGACAVAGETGAEWTVVKEGAAPNVACVTGDGIILRLRQGDRVTWEAVSVSRGPQDPQLFVVPAGYALQDFSAMSPAGSDQADPAAPAGAPGAISREEAIRMAQDMAEKAKRSQ
ncbi:MAG: hypothetical protein HXY28_02475 [Hydrogenophilaceae bacterium]|jgi:hypothetical protein|nr:hypothetical protein [Hydrogenophilaceae bacterium]